MLHSVYIIDDDHINNIICKKVITDLHPNAEVSTFLSAKEALQEFTNTSSRPNLIFLDINMPEVDGWQFLEAIKPTVAEGGPKIIMLTSSIAAQDREKANAHPLAFGLLTKPLTKARFLELMELM